MTGYLMSPYRNLLSRYNGCMQTNAPELGPDLLVDFLNTLDVEDGTDRLDDPADFRAFVESRS